MIYTTYFANVKKLPEGIEPVSIAIKTPQKAVMRTCSKFFPPANLLKGYKAKEINEAEYEAIYRRDVLFGLDAQAAARAMDGKALVCYEKSTDFCHRHIVAAWFRENGIACEEFVPPKKEKAKGKIRKKKAASEAEGSLFADNKLKEKDGAGRNATAKTEGTGTAEIKEASAQNAPQATAQTDRSTATVVPSATQPQTVPAVAQPAPARQSGRWPLRFKEIRGDLFSAPERYALAHCVSADKALGAGIALEFRKRFPNMLTKLANTSFEVGKCYGYTEPEPRRSIINIVTKEKYFEKPTYETMGKALESLREVVTSHRIKFLAIPRIGCGLDKLEWERVSYILTGVFHNTDVAIVVYVQS